MKNIFNLIFHLFHAVCALQGSDIKSFEMATNNVQ